MNEDVLKDVLAVLEWLAMTKTPPAAVHVALGRLREIVYPPRPAADGIGNVKYNGVVIHRADGTPITAGELEVGKSYTFDSTGLLLE